MFAYNVLKKVGAVMVGNPIVQDNTPLRLAPRRYVDQEVQTEDQDFPLCLSTPLPEDASIVLPGNDSEDEVEIGRGIPEPNSFSPEPQSPLPANTSTYSFDDSVVIRARIEAAYGSRREFSFDMAGNNSQDSIESGNDSQDSVEITRVLPQSNSDTSLTGTRPLSIAAGGATRDTFDDDEVIRARVEAAYRANEIGDDNEESIEIGRALSESDNDHLSYSYYGAGGLADEDEVEEVETALGLSNSGSRCPSPYNYNLDESFTSDPFASHHDLSSLNGDTSTPAMYAHLHATRPILPLSEGLSPIPLSLPSFPNHLSSAILSASAPSCDSPARPLGNITTRGTRARNLMSDAELASLFSPLKRKRPSEDDEGRSASGSPRMDPRGGAKYIHVDEEANVDINAKIVDPFKPVFTLARE